jgi:hypothetical protein
MKPDSCFSRTLWYCYTVTILVIFGAVGYQLFWPYNPIRVDRINIDKAVVAHGEKICFQFEGAKFMPVPVNVIIELVNGESFEIMKYSSNNAVGTKFKKRCFIVPHHIPPTKYQLKWSGVYPINALRHIPKSKLSDWIEVVEANSVLGSKGEKGEQVDPGRPGKDGKAGKDFWGK